MLLEESMSLQLKHEYIYRFYMFYNFGGVILASKSMLGLCAKRKLAWMLIADLRAKAPYGRQ